jgi:uncharacterized protein (TIGR00369 family)
MSEFLQIYRKLASWPFGKFLFSKGIGWRAPFFSTINARVQDYQEGRAVIKMKDRKAVHNHFGCVHAIAMCNLAEACGGMAVDSATPSSLRWIPQGMTVKYLKKARGDLTGQCQIDPAKVQPGVVEGRVEIRDPGQTLVMEAIISFKISAKPS